MSKTINIILEVLGFLLLITAVMPSFYGDQTPQAILGAVLIIYSLSRKVLVKLDA